MVLKQSLICGIKSGNVRQEKGVYQYRMKGGYLPASEGIVEQNEGEPV